jgi:hypothetical protein
VRGQQRIQGVLRRPVELLDVEEAALPHGRHQRPVHEVLGAVVLAQHPRGVVVADQLGGGQVGVALDEQQRDAPFGGDRPQQRGLAGARRPLQQDVAAGGDGGQQQIQLAAAADEVGRDPVADRRGRHVAYFTRKPASTGRVTPVTKATLPSSFPMIAPPAT